MKVLVLSAHSDDQVLGLGGTIAKHSKQGDKVVTVVYSAGEKSPVWTLKKEKLITQRMQETINADKILGVKKTIFLKYPDVKLQKFQNELNEKTLKIIREYKPEKIYVHHKKDLHPDHMAVWKACEYSLKKIKNTPEIYGYEVNSWFSPFTQQAELVVDITKEYKKKLRAIKCYKTQRYLLFFLNPLLKLRGFHYSSIYGFKYAEAFYTY
ncbi:MAG: PIG-L family deacetylase [Nanoarchaeota archaeon]|nr:PIG-L family deacetylase [Nanoarchaeota archaeon]